MLALLGEQEGPSHASTLNSIAHCILLLEPELRDGCGDHSVPQQGAAVPIPISTSIPVPIPVPISTPIHPYSYPHPIPIPSLILMPSHPIQPSHPQPCACCSVDLHLLLFCMDDPSCHQPGAV